MLYRRGIIAAVALCCAIIGAQGVARTAAAAQPAKAFLEDLAVTAMNQLADAEIAQAEREANFRSLFRQNFDLEAIGRFVLARYWRAASENQRVSFLATFEDVLVQRFLPLFRQAAGPDLNFVREATDNSQPDLVIVKSVISAIGEEPIRVDWRLAHNGEAYKILDIVAEGVSLAITYRQEYASVVSQAGGNVDALTEQLRAKVEAGAFAPASQ